MPGVISSLLLIVVGAIARYAYSDSVWRWTSGGESHSLRVDTVGGILLLTGLAGLILSFVWGFFHNRYYEEETYDEFIAKVPGEKPKKVVRRQTKKSK